MYILYFLLVYLARLILYETIIIVLNIRNVYDKYANNSVKYDFYVFKSLST